MRAGTHALGLLLGQRQLYGPSLIVVLPPLSYLLAAWLLRKPASAMGAGSCLSSSSEVSAEDRISEVCEEGSSERLQDAVRVLIQGLGEDVAREGLRDTPKVGTCCRAESPTSSRSVTGR